MIAGANAKTTRIGQNNKSSKSPPCDLLRYLHHDAIIQLTKPYPKNNPMIEQNAAPTIKVILILSHDS